MQNLKYSKFKHFMYYITHSFKVSLLFQELVDFHKDIKDQNKETISKTYNKLLEKYEQLNNQQVLSKDIKTASDLIYLFDHYTLKTSYLKNFSVMSALMNRNNLKPQENLTTVLEQEFNDYMKNIDLSQYKFSSDTIENLKKSQQVFKNDIDIQKKYLSIMFYYQEHLKDVQYLFKVDETQEANLTQEQKNQIQQKHEKINAVLQDLRQLNGSIEKNLKLIIEDCAVLECYNWTTSYFKMFFDLDEIKKDLRNWQYPGSKDSIEKGKITLNGGKVFLKHVEEIIKISNDARFKKTQSNLENKETKNGPKTI